MSLFLGASSGPVAFELEKLLSSGTLKEPSKNGGNGFIHRYPSVDVCESDESFMVTADVPGLGADDVDIEFEDGSLVISGERKPKFLDAKAHMMRAEIPYGNFCREIHLPASANPDAVVAELRDGVLLITVGKKDSAKPRRITVNE